MSILAYFPNLFSHLCLHLLSQATARWSIFLLPPLHKFFCMGLPPSILGIASTPNRKNYKKHLQSRYSAFNTKLTGSKTFTLSTMHEHFDQKEAAYHAVTPIPISFISIITKKKVFTGVGRRVYKGVKQWEADRIRTEGWIMKMTSGRKDCFYFILNKSEILIAIWIFIKKNCINLGK